MLKLCNICVGCLVSSTYLLPGNIYVGPAGNLDFVILSQSILIARKVAKRYSTVLRWRVTFIFILC